LVRRRSAFPVGRPSVDSTARVRAASLAVSTGDRFAGEPSMTADAVSVIVPIRDEAATLQDFLPALTNQRETPHEIVLVDAGSADDSVRIIRGYTATHGRMRVVESGAAYPGRARNVAIEE